MDAQHRPSSGIARAVCSWISSGFCSGHARVAPGSVGSLVALGFVGLLWWFSIVTTPLQVAFLALATTLVGLVSAHVCVSGSGEKDPGWIVIDEWAGLFVALIGVNPASVWMVLSAFCFFRLFDVVKPGPVAWAERLPGAAGIMADDLVAGALSALCVQAVWALWGSVVA